MICFSFLSASRCDDPGTPGGMRQIVTSYESGQTLEFHCIRPGYTIDGGPATRTCVTSGPDTDWDSDAVLSCKGVRKS